MIFSKQTLLEQKNNFRLYTKINSFNKLNEAKTFNENKEYDIFISHSYQDRDVVEVLLHNLISYYNFNYTFYIDWIEDSNLSHEKVTFENAAKIRKRLNKCKCLLYITSEHYIESKWMPWELGYFDAKKNKVAILPLSESSEEKNDYNGLEYLGLYPFITSRKNNNSNNGLLYVYDNNKNESLLFDYWFRNIKIEDIKYKTYLNDY